MAETNSNDTAASTLVKTCEWLKSREKYAAFAYLLVLALLVYWSTLNNAFLGDDYDLISLGNKIPFLDLGKLFSVMGTEFTRPLPLLTWWLEYHLFGLAVWPAHLFNVIVHAASAFLIFWLLSMTGARRVTAILAATLFTLAPIAPEVVVWPSGRFDGMALFFMLLSVGLYISYLNTHRKLIFSAAILAVLAALLSKEAALPLLIIIPAVEIIYGREKSGHGNWIRSGISRIAIFFGAFLAYLIFRNYVLQGMGGFSDSFELSFPKTEALKKTFGTVLSPLNMFVFSNTAIAAFGILVSVLFLLSFILLIVRRKQISLNIYKIWFLFSIFFVASLLPAYTSLFKYGLTRNLMHSRFLYVPSAAFIVLLVVGAVESAWGSKVWRIVVTSLFSALVIFFFVGLIQNNRQWDKASRIATSITEETVLLVPDPPSDAKLYYQNIPIWQEGAWVFVNGMDKAVLNEYSRSDIKIIWTPPIVDGANYYNQIAAGPVSEATKDGYLFKWDLAKEQLELIHAPIESTPAS